MSGTRRWPRPGTGRTCGSTVTWPSGTCWLARDGWLRSSTSGPAGSVTRRATWSSPGRSSATRPGRRSAQPWGSTRTPGPAPVAGRSGRRSSVWSTIRDPPAISAPSSASSGSTAPEADEGPARLSSYRTLGVSSWCASGADLEAGEPLDLDTGGVEHGLHVLLGVGDRRLVEQRDVLEEAVEATLGDLLDRLLGLALLASDGGTDLALLLDDLGGDVVAGEVLRLHRGDLHGRATSGILVAAGVLHEYADGRRQVCCTLVHVDHGL